MTTTTRTGKLSPRDLVEYGWKLTPSLMAAKLDTGYRRYRHSELIASEIVDLVAGRRRKTMILAPPQIGKTTLTSQWGPTWVLEMLPWTRLIMASYAHKLAADNARIIRNNFLTHSRHLSTRLAEDSQARDFFHTEQGGYLMAAGVDGGISGFPADGLIIDDPFKNWQEASSEVSRDTVWNWYLTAALPRVQDTGWQLIVNTRWHEQDLSGHLLEAEPGEWYVVRLPAIAEPTEDEPDPLGRAEGEVICPERFSLETTLSRMKLAGSFLSAGLYQQRPAPAEGGILKRHWWRWYEQAPHFDEVDDWLASWDMAFKDGDDSSYVVGQVWVRVGADKYLIDQTRARMDYPTTRRAVVDLARKWPKVRRHLVEAKANGPAIVSDLAHVLPGLIPVEPKGSKVARVHAVSGTIEAGNVWLPSPSIAPWIGEWVDECASFPNGAHDDVPDTLSQALDDFANRLVVPEVGFYDPAASLRGRR